MVLVKFNYIKQWNNSIAPEFSSPECSTSSQSRFKAIIVLPVWSFQILAYRHCCLSLTHTYNYFQLFFFKDCGYSFFLTSIKWVYHRLNASKTLHPEPFLAHLSTKCSVSFCDPSMSGVRRPCVRPSVRACVRQQFL